MRRVMVVDDSRVMRRMLQNTLRSVGLGELEFIEAVDGADALERLEEVGYAVDAVFCDLCMPKVDGIGVLSELGARGVLDSCPVIVLSGDVREERGAEAISCGASRLIGKPFSPEEVRDAFLAVLDGSADG